jgi:hypothetical protein
MNRRSAVALAISTLRVPDAPSGDSGPVKFELPLDGAIRWTPAIAGGAGGRNHMRAVLAVRCIASGLPVGVQNPTTYLVGGLIGSPSIADKIASASKLVSSIGRSILTSEF